MILQVQVLPFLIAVFFSGVVCQDCAPNFPDLKDGLFSPSISRQLIIPNYSFSCSAVITGWEVITTGCSQDITNLVFQVWRFDQMEGKYIVIKTTLFDSRDNTSVVTNYQNGVLHIRINLKQPKSKISVHQGDIVGAFIRGRNSVTIKYLNNSGVNTYVNTATVPLTVFNINNDEYFSKYTSVAPLIKAMIENGANGTTTGFTPDSSTVCLPSTTTRKSTQLPHTSSNGLPETSTVPPLLPSSRGIGQEDRGILANKMYFVIGVGVCGTVIVTMCCLIAIVALVIFIRRARKKRRSDHPPREACQNTFSSEAYSSENCSLSFPADSASRMNLLAFKKQEAVDGDVKTAPSAVETDFFCTSYRSESDAYVEIPPRIGYGPDSIALRGNPSYLVLNSAEVHLYDEVPFTSPNELPSEYEIPTASSNSSSARSTFVSQVDTEDKVIYEELK